MMSIEEFQQRLSDISPKLLLYADPGHYPSILIKDEAGEPVSVYSFGVKRFTSQHLLLLTKNISPEDFDKLQDLINDFLDSLHNSAENPAEKQTTKKFDKEDVLLGIASDAISVLKEMRAQK